ncbi:MAG: aspartate kinase [Ignavibacteria bacterium]|nr:aspartate kinase [Ignavibacteria bacterium]
MEITVQKFGGTSVANADSMQKVFEIVQSTSGKRIVVLSASAGITDLLVTITEVCLEQETKFTEIFDAIEKHHLKLVIELFKEPEKSAICIKTINFLLQSLRQLIEGARILDELTDKIKAEILSYGEILSTNIFYQYALSRGLNAFLLDAREIIETDNYHMKAKPNLNKIEQNSEKIHKIFNYHDVIITQGFIGNWCKETTLLGRGGSDFSASLFGYGVKAKEIQIWTDVDGIMTTDPRIVNSAKVIEDITIDEVAELSFFGAKVLHPDTIKPAVNKEIPIKVLNTFNTGSLGTTILQNSIISPTASSINSLHLVKGCFLISKKLDINSKEPCHYYQMLKDNFSKVFFFSFNSNNIKSIVKDCKFIDCETIFWSESFSYKIIDIVALFGNNLNALEIDIKNKVDTIIMKFKNELENIFPLFLSNNTILLLFKENKGEKVLGQIHSILFD